MIVDNDNTSALNIPIETSDNISLDLSTYLQSYLDAKVHYLNQKVKVTVTKVQYRRYYLSLLSHLMDQR